jgi:GT2 family glycosyltransferase
MSIHSLAVLITSFNRRESTLASLKSLFLQETPEDLQLAVILVDDGSTDGTGDAVRSMFPQVRVLDGDGSLFWNGGMRKAFATALMESFDAYLLLNDDTILYKDAVARAIACATALQQSGSPAIVVGSIRSHQTGDLSYGGISMRTRGWAIKFEKVQPHETSASLCDTMNANFALIPKQVAAVLGNLESRFRHQFGDLDYGLRASCAGFQVTLIPGYAGECNPNSSAGSWRDPKIAFAQRWRHLLSPKGVPFPEWRLFTSRHYGWRWPFYAASPYLKTIISSLLSRKRTQAGGGMALPQQ